MSLSKAIAVALDSRNDQNSPLPPSISAQEGPCRLTLEPRAIGPAGVEFQRVIFSAAKAEAEAEPEQQERSIDELKAWGDRLAARVTYLMEPLAVLEADAVGLEVTLRSQSPTPRNDRRSYYEIHLDKTGTLSMQRLGFDNQTRRRQVVPCQLSREVLERLADDLVESV